MDFFAEFGGLLFLCKMIFGFFVSSIAEAKLYSVFARKLYLLPTVKVEMLDKNNDETKKRAIQTEKHDPGKKIQATHCFAYQYMCCQVFFCCRTKDFNYK